MDVNDKESDVNSIVTEEEPKASTSTHKSKNAKEQRWEYDYVEIMTPEQWNPHADLEKREITNLFIQDHMASETEKMLSSIALDCRRITRNRLQNMMRTGSSPVNETSTYNRSSSRGRKKLSNKGQKSTNKVQKSKSRTTQQLSDVRVEVTNETSSEISSATFPDEASNSDYGQVETTDTVVESRNALFSDKPAVDEPLINQPEGKPLLPLILPVRTEAEKKPPTLSFPIAADAEEKPPTLSFPIAADVEEKPSPLQFFAPTETGRNDDKLVLKLKAEDCQIFNATGSRGRGRGRGRGRRALKKEEINGPPNVVESESGPSPFSLQMIKTDLDLVSSSKSQSIMPTEDFFPLRSELSFASVNDHSNLLASVRRGRARGRGRSRGQNIVQAVRLENNFHEGRMQSDIYDTGIDDAVESDRRTSQKSLKRSSASNTDKARQKKARLMSEKSGSATSQADLAPESATIHDYDVNNVIAQSLRPSNIMASKQITPSIEQDVKSSTLPFGACEGEKTARNIMLNECMKLPMPFSRETNLESISIKELREQQKNREKPLETFEAFRNAALGGRHSAIRWTGRCVPERRQFDFNEKYAGKTVAMELSEKPCDKYHSVDDMLRQIVQDGANLHIQDAVREWLPLHKAIVSDLWCRVRTLLLLKSPVNIRDKFGSSPLQCLLCSRAEKTQVLRIMYLLLEYGADVNDILKNRCANTANINRYIEKLEEYQRKLTLSFGEARMKVLINMTVKRDITPVIVRSLWESQWNNFITELSFNYETTILPNDRFLYIIVLGVFDNKSSKDWRIRLWGRSPFAEVKMNDQPVQCLQAKSNGFIYATFLQNGFNTLKLRYFPYVAKKKLLALAQVLLVQLPRSTYPGSPPKLEIAI